MLVGCFGLMVCYDLCFLEFYIVLCEVGVELIMVLLVFIVVIGVVYWQVLVCVCVIEIQCYLLVVGQGGVYLWGWEMFGYLVIVDFWGWVLVEWLQGEVVLLVVCDVVEQVDICWCMLVVVYR